MCKLILEKIRNKWTPEGKAYDLPVMCSDNLGMCRKMGYVQYTMLNHQSYPAKVLIDAGIYPDPSDPDSQGVNFTQPTEWEDIKDGYTFHISPDDCHLLVTEVTLPTMSYALHMVEAGTLPSVDDARAFLDSNQQVDFDSDIPQRASARRFIPDSERGGDTIVGTSDLTARDIEEVNEQDGDLNELEVEEAARGSIYDVNHATIDLPLKRDLAANATCSAIIKYGMELVDRCLGKDDYSDSDGSNVDGLSRVEAMAQVLWPNHVVKPLPISRMMGCLYCNDGGPTYAMQKIIESEHRDRPMHAFFGLFHTLLELRRKRGEMCGPTYLRDIWKQWRKSEKQQDWVMNPGDPNQVDSALFMYILAVYMSAATELMRERGIRTCYRSIYS